MARASQVREIIRVDVDARQFRQEANRINRELGSIRRQASLMGNTLRGAFSIFAARQAFRAIQDLVNLTDEMNRLEMAAERLGGDGALGLVADTADELGVRLNEALGVVQRFAPAFEKLGRGFQDATDFAGDLQQALRLYGVTTQEALSVTTQLAQGLSSGQLAGDELKSLRENAGGLAFEFERAVGEILDTNESLKDLGSQGRLTADVVLQAFERTFENIRGDMESLPDTLEMQEARMLTAWNRMIDSMLGSAQGLTEFFGETLPDIAIDAMNRVALWFNRTDFGSFGTQLLQQDLERVQKQIEELERGEIPLWMPAEAVQARLEQFRREQGALQKELAAREAATVLPTAVVTAPPLSAGGSGGGGGGGRVPRGAGGGGRDLEAERVRELTEAIQRLREELDPAARLQRQFAEGQDLIAEATERGILTVAESVELAGQFTERAIADMDALTESIERVENVAAPMANAFVGAFDSMIFEARSFGDVLTALERDLIRFLSRALVTEPLFNLLTGGNAFPAGGAAAALVGGLGKLIGLADGGAFRAGQPILVGERGPELMVPRTAGTVVPNEDLRAGGDIHIHFHGPVSGEGLRQSAAQIAGQVGAATARASARNG